MEINIIDIGNSKGIRIPKAILEQGGFSKKATLNLTEEGIIIAPAKKKRKKKLREGWAESAAKYAKHYNAAEEFADWHAITTDFEKNEWTW